MKTQNVIKTLFEFTSSGYEAVKQEQDDTLARIANLKKEERELNKIREESVASIDKFIKKWEELNKTMSDGTPKEVREFYAQLPKMIDTATAAQAKATAQKEANTKAQDAENKKLKEASDTMQVYQRVMHGLGKEAGTAEVSLKQLQTTQKLLKKELTENTTVGSPVYLALSKQLSQVNKEINTVKESQRQADKEFGVTENSIESLRLKVAALNKEWKLMDRNDPDFSKVRDELAATTEELKNAEQEVGIFSRSVGNYEKGIQGLVSGGNPLLAQMIGITSAAPTAAGAMKTLTSSVKSFGMALKALLANPIVAIIAAVVAVFIALKKVLNSSEEATARFNAILAPLRMIMDTVLNVLQKLVSFLLSGVEAFLELGMAVSKFLEKIPFVGKYIKEANDAIAESIKLEREKYELEKKIRDQQVETAKNDRDIAEMRAKAVEKDKYTAEQRLKFIQEAAALEKENADAALAIAQEKLRIAEAEASRAENTKETEEALAQLRADVFRAEQNHANKMRKLNSQQAAFLKEIDDEKKKRESDAKSAADKARAAQHKNNADYIKAAQDRMKAAEDVAKAEIEGDTKALELFKKILSDKDAELQMASKKRLTLSQLEKDELELQEYQHQKALKEIKEKAAEDKKKKTADDYIKAKTEYRDAQAALLEAQKRGNEEEIALYKRLLTQKGDALGKFNGQQVELSNEQRLADDIANHDHQQKIIADYIAMEKQLAELKKQYDEAETQAQRETIQKQIDNINTKVAVQLDALRALGIYASDIQVDAIKSADKAQEYLTARLEESLKTIEQFSGKSKNNFFKLASSISGLVTKAFDIKKIRAKYGDDAKGIAAANKEIKQSFIDLGAAMAINGLNAATDIINQNIEQEKKAIDEMYAYQQKRAQETYDQDVRDLKASYADKQMSEAKYRLEQMKLDDKKAEADKKREKDKANTMYELELKQFRVNQAKDATSTGIATALAIMQGYAQGGPFAGIGFQAMLTALGAAQVGLIYAQKPPQKPKFEKGGGIRFEDIDGPSHGGGGVPIRFGNKIVAEAEGDEGALIISKKAMRNSYMRRLLGKVLSANRKISGDQSDSGIFEEGGALSFKSYDEDFFAPAKNSLKITKRRKRSIRINGKKVKLKPYGFSADAAIDDYAEKIAVPKWNAYIDEMRGLLDAREAEINNALNAGISSNTTLKSMGIGSVEDYNKKVIDTEKELDVINKQIKVYEDAAKARIDALKSELQYEQKLADFEKQRKDAANDLAKTTEEFNTRVLGELRQSGQITEDEYMSMLDQIKHGYGVKTSDIINLKKEEVEAIKKLINEERTAELDAAKVTAKYREEALAQIRSEWEDNYNAVTQQIIEDAESASEAISQLTGTDLERFNQILRIQREIQKMEEDYQKNETLLSDGVITNREERAAIIAEQKRIKEELDRKQKEVEEAKTAFEAERQKNMEAARKAYETENFTELLAQIKALGSDLQSEGNKWTLDKQLATELDDNLKQINATYDDQIAKQDAIIEGLQNELDTTQLLHDKKVAYIKEEEDALKNSFETQKAQIESWLADATADMRAKAANLNGVLAALKVAGYEAGLSEYEAAMEVLNKDIGMFDSKGSSQKYETGGAIEIGSGLYQVSGRSHTQGGVPVKVGNTEIANVEDIEKMFVVNKMASQDPELIAALAKASDVNARYTGVPLINNNSSDGFVFDYDLFAAKFARLVNDRPSKFYTTHNDIHTSNQIAEMQRKTKFMQ